MKVLILAAVLATFAFAVDSATKGLGARIECLDGEKYESRIYEAKIKDAIMKLAEKLGTEGLPAQGIPPLEPFVLDNFHIGLNQSLAQLNWNMTAGQIDGLTKLEIPTLTLSLAGLKFTYGFSWADIHGQGKYQLDGVFGGLLPIYGNGDFNVEVKNLLVAGSGKLGSDENKFLYLEKFEIFISIEEFVAKFTGLMNDEPLSSLLSEMITDSVPALLEQYKQAISDFLSPQIIKIADKFLENKTLSDIMGGLGREYIACNQHVLV